MKGKGMKMITRRRDGGVPSEVGRFEVHGFDARIHSVPGILPQCKRATTLMGCVIKGIWGSAAALPYHSALLRGDEFFPEFVVEQNFAEKFGVAGAAGGGGVGIEGQADGEGGA